MSSEPSNSPTGDVAAVLEGTLPRLNGKPDDLSGYRGKVVLVVNTATECGFTPQFDGLEKLYEQKRDEGLVILHRPTSRGDRPDLALLERVLYGLRTI